MKYLIVGGHRQGQWVELAYKPTGATWVDLLTTETYRVRRITWAVEGPIAGVAAELFKLPVLVHPSLCGHPLEKQLVTYGVFQVVAEPHMDAFMREKAEPQEMAEPELPPVPDTPAEVLADADGEGA